MNGDNMDIVGREHNRNFRTKKREYLKDKINVFGTNSNKKTIRGMYRGINEFNVTNLELTW
jgi:hypothetical protein